MADHASGDVAKVNRQAVLPRRFSAAMAALPGARDRELSPLLTVPTGRRRHLLDLFSGDGYVSRTLGRTFARRTLVDIRRIEPSALPLRGADSPSSGFTRITGDATDPTVLGKVPAAVDYAVCLAGFHHAIVVSKRRIDIEATRRSRVQTLRRWRELLVPGGFLAVADVPERGLDLSGPLGRDATAFKASGAETDLAPRQDRRLENLDWSEPDPAGFFDDVVALARVGGHDAVFETPDSLVASFTEAGFKDVRSAILPTPWEFPSEELAVWFIHELLAIGSRAETPEDLSASEYRSLRQAIDRYLGLRSLADGTVLVLWKLLYVWGVKS